MLKMLKMLPIHVQYICGSFLLISFLTQGCLAGPTLPPLFGGVWPFVKERIDAMNATAWEVGFTQLRAKKARTSTSFEDKVDIYGPYTSTEDVRNIRPTAASANSAYTSILSEFHSSAESALTASSIAAISSAEAAMSYDILNATGTEGNVFTFTIHSGQIKRAFDTVSSMTMEQSLPTTIPADLVDACASQTLDLINIGLKVHVVVFEDSLDVRVDNVGQSCGALAEAVMNADPGLGPHPFKASYDSLQWVSMPADTISRINEFFVENQQEVEDA